MSVNIKHAGKVYPMKLSATTTGADLRESVERLVQIPSSRQKYMIKGGLIDDVLVSDVIKPGANVMLLGTPDKDLIVKPKNTEKFIEDLDKNEQGQHLSKMPMGIANLGNTCYMNATLQGLFRIDPLREQVLEFDEKRAIKEGVDTYHAQLVRELKVTFQKLKDRKGENITPLLLLEILRRVFPQFSETDPQGGFYKQQDAEELFTQLFHTLKTVFGSKLMDNFQIDFRTTLQDTTNESDVIEKVEDDLKLQCHITGATNFMKSGIKESLRENITKRSELTGASSTYSVEKKITKLPAYLTVQYVRFFWKKSTGKKSKILRKVQFPFQLDVADLLDSDYAQEKIKVRDAIREVHKERVDENAEVKRAQENVSSPSATQALASISSTAESRNERWATEVKALSPPDLRPGENPSCIYDLIGVITHQGANSESGHYQAFIRDDADEKWYRFDDDKVTAIEKEKIESLAGGGESDSALILIYKGLGL
ncbi:ubiquitin-specific protease UBP6 Ecym_2717 [Eremothecium cymbalariae DBVPG|uniref:Ubiquitin carboxyl-terminal hydrolase n=1 Tax=Eremothecium cymbalariae (strain CBS 270.75 / DBVPG 7215 / KCTC 17166 / NRRL Y-17582) TaxID=931890 RepID=G8JPF5_ERECY|nr:Hypothetical protein Ecym_2717 [Eremothecium cymbalariae DBVPG\